MTNTWSLDAPGSHESNGPRLVGPDLSQAHELARELAKPAIIPLPATLKPPASFDNTPQRVGRAIQRQRQAHHLSQRELAEMVGVDPSYISKIEHAAVSPLPWSVIERLVKALGVSMSDFCFSIGALEPRATDLVARNEYAREFIHLALHGKLDDAGWVSVLHALRRHLSTAPYQGKEF